MDISAKKKKEKRYGVRKRSYILYGKMKKRKY